MPTVKNARARLFGSWEMNWIAYNFGHDVTLPASTAGPLAFFMYPQAETARGRLDCLDPDVFEYRDHRARGVESPAFFRSPLAISVHGGYCGISTCSVSRSN